MSIEWYNVSNMNTKDNKAKRPLTPEQEQFCILYTSRGDFSGLGYKCYAEAYGYDLPLRDDGEIDTKSKDYATCRACASKLLTVPSIGERIRDIYLEKFNDKDIDARLNEIIYNGAESNSIQAIKIANDLKQRITKKVDITSGGRPLAGLSDEELQALAD